MAPAERGLSIRAYAKYRRAHGLRGGNASAVQKAIDSGRISCNQHGKIDPVQADRQWAQNSDGMRGGGHAAPAGAFNPAPVGTPGAPDYRLSRSIREAYAARLAKLEYERKAELLVEAAQVQAEAFGRARVVRDSILAVPQRVAAILAAETDPAKVQILLADELRKALENLAGAEG